MYLCISKKKLINGITTKTIITTMIMKNYKPKKTLNTKSMYEKK
jgi:hypothetical protein